MVQQGTLKCGSVLVAGEGWAKVRKLIGRSGQNVKEATPSIPVLTTGWRELPEAGQKCLQVRNNKKGNDSSKSSLERLSESVMPNHMCPL